MKPANLLFVFSDEHRRDVAGCYGHPLVQTPNLDRLAGRGVRFTRAYTNSPICVAARAALSSGRYVHQTGHWDNAFPYHGEVTSWMHRVRDSGSWMQSIGKLHFRSKGDDNGFSDEHEPLHVAEGIGEIIECMRHKAPPRDGPSHVRSAGPGDSSYLHYDAQSTEEACRFIADHAGDEKPWVLFLSLVCPHPPFTAPRDLFELYDPATIKMPPQWQREDWPDHPALQHFRYRFNWEDALTEEEIKTSGTIALCKYNRLMITSPRDLVYGYGWADTVAHELIHLLINRRSRNTVPICVFLVSSILSRTGSMCDSIASVRVSTRSSRTRRCLECNAARIVCCSRMPSSNVSACSGPCSNSSRSSCRCNRSAAADGPNRCPSSSSSSSSSCSC